MNHTSTLPTPLPTPLSCWSTTGLTGTGRGGAPRKQALRGFDPFPGRGSGAHLKVQLLGRRRRFPSRRAGRGRFPPSRHATTWRGRENGGGELAVGPMAHDTDRGVARDQRLVGKLVLVRLLRLARARNVSSHRRHRRSRVTALDRRRPDGDRRPPLRLRTRRDQILHHLGIHSLVLPRRPRRVPLLARRIDGRPFRRRKLRPLPKGGHPILVVYPSPRRQPGARVCPAIGGSPNTRVLALSLLLFLSQRRCRSSRRRSEERIVERPAELFGERSEKQLVSLPLRGRRIPFLCRPDDARLQRNRLGLVLSPRLKRLARTMRVSRRRGGPKRAASDDPHRCHVRHSHNRLPSAPLLLSVLRTSSPVLHRRCRRLPFLERPNHTHVDLLLRHYINSSSLFSTRLVVALQSRSPGLGVGNAYSSIRISHLGRSDGRRMRRRLAARRRCLLLLLLLLLLL